MIELSNFLAGHLVGLEGEELKKHKAAGFTSALIEFWSKEVSLRALVLSFQRMLD